MARKDPNKLAAAEVWPRCQNAARIYGKRWLNANPKRLGAMAERLDELDALPTWWKWPKAAALPAAIHGYMWHCRRGKGDFDALRYLTPETIYRPSNFPRYLEAFTEAVESGHTWPRQGGEKWRRIKRANSSPKPAPRKEKQGLMPIGESVRELRKALRPKTKRDVPL